MANYRTASDVLLLQRDRFIAKRVEELVHRGAITPQGKLSAETTVEDILSGKYSKLFSRAVSKEVINEGTLIEQTLNTLFEWSDLNQEEWAKEAKKELELIGTTLKTLKGSG